MHTDKLRGAPVQPMGKGGKFLNKLWCYISGRWVKYFSTHTLLNYFIIIRKLFLWDCRRKQIHPKIQGYQNKIAIKYEIERKINKKNFFEKKWIFKWKGMVNNLKNLKPICLLSCFFSLFFLRYVAWFNYFNLFNFLSWK